MQRRHYAKGDIVIREGDPSDAVCRIIEGRVEIIKGDGARSVVLGHIGQDEFVGEMGVIEGRVRSATVRADTDVTVDWVMKDDFLRRVSENSETSLKLIARLSERLGSINQAYSEAILSGRSLAPADPVQTSSPGKPASSKIVIYGDSPDLAGVLPVEGLVVDTYPFFVGRTPGQRESAPSVKVDLSLNDSKPYRISRVHFAIFKNATGVQVRDLESQLGTSVNGELLGHHFSKDMETLAVGENLITAGGIDSPYRFRAVL
jgi:pSer/pThr/pTyr-binding forkhead associated (FHA) protein